MFFLLKVQVVLGMTIMLHFPITTASNNCSDLVYKSLRLLMGKAYLPDVMSTEIAVHPQKRAELSRKLPWTCTSQHDWQDLGPNYYPRFVRTTRCLDTVCWLGIFRCREKKSTLQILRRQSKHEDVCNLDDEENFVGDLSQSWKFVDHGITVCCECSR